MSTLYFESNTLQHHGILGQKWGVRRYQNADGSYTDAGARRRNSSGNARPEKLNYTQGETVATRGVKKDYNSMSDAEFKKKYAASKDTYAKRVAKYGDPYAHASKSYMKVAEKGVNKEYRKAEKKNAKIQKDIDSFKGLENGIYTKNGKMLLSSADVNSSIAALKETQAKNRSKVQNMINKIDTTNNVVVFDVMTNSYSIRPKTVDDKK